MSSDKIHALEGLRAKLKSAQTRADRLRLTRDQLQVDLQSKRDEVLRLAARQEVLVKVMELYRILMNKMILGQVQAIEKVVSDGLKTIFYDQNLSFGFDLDSKYNKSSAEPFLQNGDIKGDPLESFGGGPASLVSLMLRIMVIRRLKRFPLLLLDETLAAVSDGYIEPTGQFLKKLAESSGFPILLVTHKPAFLEHVTNGYQGDTKVQEGQPEFVVKKIR